MATHTLVEPLNNNLAALIGLSLKKHEISVTDEFWLHSAETRQTKLAIVTPLVDERGVRESYLQFFNALNNETFSSQLTLRTILYAIGEQEAAPALKALKSSAPRLPSLGPYEDVDIFPVPDASQITMSGFLHFTPNAGPSESCLVTFGPLGQSTGAMKPRTISQAELPAFLDKVRANSGQRSEIDGTLRKNQSASILLDNINLATLYEAGLI